MAVAVDLFDHSEALRVAAGDKNDIPRKMQAADWLQIAARDAAIVLREFGLVLEILSKARGAQVVAGLAQRAAAAFTTSIKRQKPVR